VFEVGITVDSLMSVLKQYTTGTDLGGDMNVRRALPSTEPRQIAVRCRAVSAPRYFKLEHGPRRSSEDCSVELETGCIRR
jgi:hypothetical protein